MGYEHTDDIPYTHNYRQIAWIVYSYRVQVVKLTGGGAGLVEEPHMKYSCQYYNSIHLRI